MQVELNNKKHTIFQISNGCELSKICISDIPDLLEHRLEIVPLLVTIGNGLEVKCDVTMSHEVIWRRNGMDLALLNFPGISVGNIFTNMKVNR